MSTRRKRYVVFVLFAFWWLYVVPMAYLWSASFIFDVFEQPEDNIHRLIVTAYEDYNISTVTEVILGFICSYVVAVAPQNRVRGATPRWCVECQCPVDESNPPAVCPKCGADLTREGAIDGGVPIARWPGAIALFVMSALLAGYWVWSTFFFL